MQIRSGAAYRAISLMLSKLDVPKAPSIVSTARTALSKARTSPYCVRRVRQSTVAALGFFRKRIATSGAVDDILAAVEGSERGCCTSRSQKARINAALGVLEEAGDNTRPISKGLSATWKMVWTTEKVRLPVGTAVQSRS